MRIFVIDQKKNNFTIVEGYQDFADEKDVKSFLQDVCGYDLNNISYLVQGLNTKVSVTKVSLNDEVTENIMGVVATSIADANTQIKSKEIRELIDALMEYGNEEDETYSVEFKGDKPVIAGWIACEAADIIITSVSYNKNDGLAIFGYGAIEEGVAESGEEIDVEDILCGQLEFVTDLVKKN